MLNVNTTAPAVSRGTTCKSCALRVRVRPTWMRRCQSFNPSTWPRNVSASATSPTETERDHNGHIDFRKLLATPTWSVASLLGSRGHQINQPQISSQQLHHLLRLSALPPPRDAGEEARMLSTLSSQLHFVREIQSVDTTGIAPLRSLRDETSAGEKEAELGMAALKGALDAEEVRGKHHKRIRRRRDMDAETKANDWDPLATASRKVGRYFVVEKTK